MIDFVNKLIDTDNFTKSFKKQQEDKIDDTKEFSGQLELKKLQYEFEVEKLKKILREQLSKLNEQKLIHDILDNQVKAESLTVEYLQKKKDTKLMKVTNKLLRQGIMKNFPSISSPSSKNSIIKDTKRSGRRGKGKNKKKGKLKSIGKTKSKTRT